MQISNICQSYQQQRETLMTATMSHSAFCRHNYLNNTQCPLQYFKMTKSYSGLETVLYMHRSYEGGYFISYVLQTKQSYLRVAPFEIIYK